MIVSWEEFKVVANSHIQEAAKGSFIYRGQFNSSWNLSTSLHRTGQIEEHKNFVGYFENILPFVQEPVEAWDGSRRDLTNPLQLAEFLAFLQHNGFPTPLLDWTFSPYIAAYFAFEGINHFTPQNDFVAIYAFNQGDWIKSYKQTHDYKPEAKHVTILNPTYRANPKQMLQQGTFMFTNLHDIEFHIHHNEKTQGQFLNKYEISVKERPKIFKDLIAMNITAMQLMPGMESVCKKVFAEICATHEVGMSPGEFKSYSENVLARSLSNAAAMPAARETVPKRKPKGMVKE